MTNILKIDYDKFVSEISDRPKKPDYIIMNEETGLFLAKETIFTLGYHGFKNISDTYNQFRGIPIAVCNKLKFGEVKAVYEYDAY